MKNKIREWLLNENAKICFNDIMYDYDSICNQIESVARKLSLMKLNSENVGIYLDRTPNIIYSLIATMITGHVYVPVDNTMPTERINFIFSDANVECVITVSKYKDLLKNKKLILLDDTDNELLDDRSICDDAMNDDAYILYTSGSTGTPKGVKITKHSLHNFIDGVANIIDFKEKSTIACFTSLSFDIFFLESIMALNKGLYVYFANEQQVSNPIKSIQLIIQNNIEMLQLTPSRMQQLINCDSSIKFLQNIKTLMVGGEALPEALLKKIQDKSTCKIYNMYGPTETTIWSSIGNVTESPFVHAGYPIKNTRTYIVGEDLGICDFGVKGELCIAGDGLAKEYYNNPDLTEGKFIMLSGERAYRTGDYALLSEDNQLKILGRIDNQVKIRGHRIELEEIENIITRTGFVDKIVVLAININENGDKVLVAFYLKNEIDVEIEQLKSALCNILPVYMIPREFYPLDEFPLTVSGKVDRNKIIINYLHNSDIVEEEEISDIAIRVIKTIKKCIAVEDFNINMQTDLASVGVDSVTFVKLIVDLECEFDIEFMVEDDMENMVNLKKVYEWVDFVIKRMSSINASPSF